jgi:hypothetical protein
MAGMDVDSSIVMLRALLEGDFESYRRFHAELPPAQHPAFAVLLTAALNQAATRRFGEHPNIADVVEFVADSRARYPRTAETMRAEDAENVIMGILGEEQLLRDASGKTKGAVQAAMLFALVQSSNASSDDIDVLLNEAGAQAAAYLRRRAEREGQR